MTPAGTEYETVIGLEIHVQLDTRSKLFCGCAPRFGDPPNVHVCPVCLGLPGALPVLNRRAVRMARRVALALGCRLESRSGLARKNYFYPDLPKGYQISQFARPVGREGRFEFVHGDAVREVGFVRVHLEEDAGKSTHRQDRGGRRSLVDLNRCGTPLVEAVTRPQLHSPEEATDFLSWLRTTLLYLGVTDANMEEGSLRCDANISLREPGSGELNPKTELKNLNSFRFLRRALRYERRRQSEILRAGEVPEPSTRSWDEAAGITREMRVKEEAHDYRYFPEPDLVAVTLDDDEIERLRASIPELPLERARRLTRERGVELEEASHIVAERAAAELFEDLVEAGVAGPLAGNWIRGPVQAWLNERGASFSTLPAGATTLAELIGAVEDGTISHRTAKHLLPRVLEGDDSPRELIRAEGLQQMDDRAQLAGIVDRVLAEHPEEVDSYRGGNEKVLGFLMGRVMAATGGQAEPGLARELLRERLGR